MAIYDIGYIPKIIKDQEAESTPVISYDTPKTYTTKDLIHIAFKEQIEVLIPSKPHWDKE